MRLREEVVTAYNTHECPINDYLCSYFENGGCRCKDAEIKCDHMRKNRGTDKKDKKMVF